VFEKLTLNPTSSLEGFRPNGRSSLASITKV